MDTQHLMKPLTLGIIFSFTVVANIVNADDKFADIAIRQAVVEQMEFIQIPGPNPIISPGPEGSWDDRVVEAPHLITPVVIDPKKAAASLNWLINEMEERYRLFAHLRVRNIEVYNESVQNGEITVDDAENEEPDSYSVIRKLPYIV